MLEEPKTSDFRKRIKEREAAEKKRMEKWRKEFKKQMSNHAYAPNTPIFNNITSTNPGDPYITASPVTGVQVTGDLTVNGRNVMEELDVIKTLLDGAVIQRDPAMEEEFGKLKELADAYQEQLEKYKTFKALKESA